MAITLFVHSTPPVGDSKYVNSAHRKAADEFVAKFSDERPLSATEQAEIDYLNKLAEGKTPTAAEAMAFVRGKHAAPEPKAPKKSF
jgi:hypothetical protein